MVDRPFFFIYENSFLRVLLVFFLFTEFGCRVLPVDFLGDFVGFFLCVWGC